MPGRPGSRTLVVGDVHGQFLRLLTALASACYDPSRDRLIFLGDLVDRGPDSYGVVEHIHQLRMLGADVIFVGGNHDIWFAEDFEMLNQFVDARTIGSYIASGEVKVPEEHRAVFRSMVPYHAETIDGRRTLFVHGGYDVGRPVSEHAHVELAWDRALWAANAHLVDAEDIYDQVFIGHTPVDQPATVGRVTNIDTGAGWRGRVCVMDVVSRTSWLSPPVALARAS